MKHSIWSYVILLLFLLSCFIVADQTSKWRKHHILMWDTAGYNHYLPAIFIYHDLSDMAYLEGIEKKYRITGKWKRVGIHTHSITGRSIIKFPIGVAILQSPFFLIADLYVSSGKQYPRDGYSGPYQYAVFVGTVSYLFIGFLFLIRFLQAYLKDRYIALALLFLCFGTNLFFYTAIFPGSSHPYLFCIYCITLRVSQRWVSKPTGKQTFLLGVLIGLAVILRPTDILLGLIPVCWFVGDRGKEIFQPKILVGILGFLVPILLQLLYWKWATGQFVYYSYEKEGFHFLEPKIWKGLFSYRRGWFVYTPLALIGLVGLVFFPFVRASGLQKPFAGYCLGSVLYYLISFYVLFSWWMWFYGGGFGCRVLIQSLPLLALPIGLLGVFLAKKGLWFIRGFVLVVLLGLSLNLFQTWQMEKSILTIDQISKEYYWKVFLRTSYSQEDRKLLKSEF